MSRNTLTTLKRRLKIAEIVRMEKEVKVDELAEKLDVSGVTIRNDLNYLAQQGYLTRSFGGAVYTKKTENYTTSSQIEPIQDKAVLIELAEQFCKFIQDDDVIFLGAGIMSSYIIPLLRDRKNLSLVVNDFSLLSLARCFIDGEVICLGGSLSQSGDFIIGKNTVDFFDRLNVTVALIEINDIQKNGDVFIQNAEIAPLIRHILTKVDSSHLLLFQSDKTVCESVGNIKRAKSLTMTLPRVNQYHSTINQKYFVNQSSNNSAFTWSV